MRRVVVPNPASGSLRSAEYITDRAKRYRAQRVNIPGPRLCHFCGDPRPRDRHHVNGREADNAPHNLSWACRSCNTAMGAAAARSGVGQRTRQFNPAAPGAQTLAQWVQAVLAAKGQSDEMSVAQAVQMIHATPPERRSTFAAEIWRRRRARGGAPC